MKLYDAQKYGIQKSFYNGGSMGAVFFIIYAVYALAFWYGAKLVRDEPENYSGGKILIVSGIDIWMAHYKDNLPGTLKLISQ